MKKEEQKAHKQSFWYKLDNAAKIFPGQNSGRWSNIFRVSLALDQKVDPIVLEKALEEVMDRFPCFAVRMRRGFFWYYLEKNDNKAPDVLPDIKNPLYRVRWKENKRFLFRVYYYENKISVDFYHSLTDGYGASLFLSTLGAQYLRLRGERIPAGKSVLSLDEEASEEELEDSFGKHGNSKGKPQRRGKFVYHARGTRMPPHTFNLTTGLMSADAVLSLAKSFGVTVTELFAAILLDIFHKKQKQEERRQRQISVQIPVNLRKTFKSKSLRNFTMCYEVRIDPNLGDYTFEEILKQTSLYLRYVNNSKELNAMMTQNLKLERSLLLRAMPLVIKKIGVAISFVLTGERRTSTLLTNLGIVDLPEEMLEHVKHAYFLPAPGILNGARIGVGTCNNVMTVTFANIYHESDIEREFFTRLVKMGIHIKIESNRD